MNRIFDVPYKTVGNTTLHVDIHYPKGFNNEKIPVAVYIHGGGWLGGSKNIIGSKWGRFSECILEKNIAVVCVQYRLCNKILKRAARAAGVVNPLLKFFTKFKKTKKTALKFQKSLSKFPKSLIKDATVKYPQPCVDVMDALRFIVKNADIYNFDTEHMAVFGGSAGGHLSLLAGVAQNIYREDNEYKDIDFKINCIGDICGPTELLSKSPEMNTEGKLTLLNFLGVWKLSFHKKKIKELSPITYVREGLPPLGIFHSENDELVPVTQSYKIEKAWRKKGNLVETTYVTGYTHSLGDLSNVAKNISFEEIANKLADFICRYIV